MEKKIGQVQKGRLAGNYRSIAFVSQSGVEISDRLKLEFPVTFAFPYDSGNLFYTYGYHHQAKKLNIITKESTSFPLKINDNIIEGFKLPKGLVCLINNQGILSIWKVQTGKEVARIH